MNISFQGTIETYPISESLGKTVPFANTPYSVNILRYLPHATVTADNQLANVSDEPVNPAIEVQITGHGVSEKRIAFANFPKFASSHGGTRLDGLDLTFVAGQSSTSGAPIEILSAPDGQLFARFQAPGKAMVTAPVTPGKPLPTPFGPRELIVHRHLTHAAREYIYEAVDPPRDPRVSAVLLRLTSSQSSNSMWVQKYRPRAFSVDGAPFEIAFGDEQMPLGFTLTLKQFRIGHYPGGQRPRSFESTVSIADARRGFEQTRIISMNNPTEYGGFTFFQSSYQKDGKTTASILSVSRDPGRPIVFTGYIGMMVGMVIVFCIRISDRRRAGSVERGRSGRRRPTVSVDLLHAEERCLLREEAHALQATYQHQPCREERVNGRNREGKSAYVKLIGLLVLLALPGVARATELPQNLDLSTIRRIPVQHDGRFPPLETLARDLVESVTGELFYRGADPVLTFLGMTFQSDKWMDEPLIRIGNAELRSELKLPGDRTRFSYRELVNHDHVRTLVTNLARIEKGRKMNPLESKVSDINQRLGTLQRVFRGLAIRVIPVPDDLVAAWSPLSPGMRTDDPLVAGVMTSWEELGAAFRDDAGERFAASSVALADTLNALPAAYRPAESAIGTELHYNKLRPFRLSWMAMMLGAVFAGLALVLRRIWCDLGALVATVIGFGMLSYGLWLRWQIAGHIPASNMYESLLFLGWGVGAFAIIALIFIRERLVVLTASFMGAVSLLLADLLPIDHYIRPTAPVLLDTIWMSIHVPVIMVSYSVLALGVLIAHVQLVVMVCLPRRVAWAETIDRLHYLYIHIGVILLAAGIITGSMWAASSWGRYWGWDPKEVWSLVALIGYLAVLHIRINQEHVPKWLMAVGGLLGAALFAILIVRLQPISSGKLLALGGTAFAIVLFVTWRGMFATAVKSVLCFWLIIMTYVGVNFVLGIGLHSYGFGTGAVVYYMFLLGSLDLAFVTVCSIVHLLRMKMEVPTVPGVLPAS
jgi:ABC-type transport system involved in cytochrome c biogenesis permease subunit